MLHGSIAPQCWNFIHRIRQAKTNAPLITHWIPSSPASPATFEISLPDLLINYCQTFSKRVSVTPIDLNKAASPPTALRFRHKTQHAQRKGLKVPISTLCTGDEGKIVWSIMGHQKPSKGGLGMKKEARVDQGQSKMRENGQVRLPGD